MYLMPVNVSARRFGRAARRSGGDSEARGVTSVRRALRRADGGMDGGGSVRLDLLAIQIDGIRCSAAEARE